MQPKISVIIPVYNVEKYLRECLDSVVNQTLKDIEIICVNDGSTDNSLEILKEYEKQDSRIKVLNHKKNKGLGGARNTGLNSAVGEYIVFIDSDDFVTNNMVEKLLTNLVNNEADMSFCDMWLYESNEQVFYNKPFQIYNLSEYNLYFPQERIEPFTNIWPSAWNKIYKKAIIDKFHLRYLENIFYEDHLFYYNYLLHCKRVSYLSEALYFYRHTRQDSIMQNVSSRIFEIFIILEYLEKLLKKILKKDDFRRIFIKIKSRLLWERTFPFKDDNKIINLYIETARKELAKYSYDEIYRYKDDFIDMECPIFKEIPKNKQYLVEIKTFPKWIDLLCCGKRILRLKSKNGKLKEV